MKNISFQIGAEAISVYGREHRTTCAVEAFNGVLNKGIKGNGNFYNFVDYIRDIDLKKSIKLRNLIPSAGLQLVKRRAQYKVLFR